MHLSPIALFVYNRPVHTRQAVESLKANDLAKNSELFIFSDAPKNDKSRDSVKVVRDYLKTIEGFRKVLIYERNENLGPAKSIIMEVADIVNRFGKVIVLEDDLVVSKYFLDFMNNALSFYKDESKIISICGYMYPVKASNCETLFLTIPDCWGWATWKRGWDLLEPDAQRLLEQLKSKKLGRQFNLNGGYDFLKMLTKQARNEISSWAICWYASSLLNDKLSLHPAKSLVRNIGFDDLGTHCSNDAGYDVDIFQKKVNISKIPLTEDRYVIRKIGMLFRINRFKKIGHIIRKWLKISS